MAQPLLQTTNTAGTCQTPAMFSASCDVTLRGRTVAEDADDRARLVAQPQCEGDADGVGRLTPDGDADREVLSGPAKSLPRSSPPQ